MPKPAISCSLPADTILVIDDFYRNSEDALSETVREKQRDWYLSTSTTRLAPHGGIVMFATRWHKEDLYAFAKRTEEEAGGVGIFAPGHPVPDHPAEGHDPADAIARKLEPQPRGRDDDDAIVRPIGDLTDHARSVDELDLPDGVADRG